MMHHGQIEGQNLEAMLPVRIQRMIDLMYDFREALKIALDGVPGDDLPHCPPIRILDQSQSAIADAFDRREGIFRLVSVRDDYVGIDTRILHYAKEWLEVRFESVTSSSTVTARSASPDSNPSNARRWLIAPAIIPLDSARRPCRSLATVSTDA